MIIYKTINLINGKIYIGQDTLNDPAYMGSGKLFIKAIKKYGKKNFKKEIIEICSCVEELNEREIYWIQYYNSTDHKIGYNISTGGLGHIGSGPHNEDRKKKISQARMGMKFSEEHKINMRKPKSKESNLKRSIALKGKKKSLEARQNMSKSKIGCTPWNKGLTKETDERMRLLIDNRVKKLRDKKEIR